MSKVKNPVWRFFASVHLALMSLIILAATSVIGTLIQQEKPPSYYAQEYGQAMARFFEILGITNMYRSWWFVTLLGLFAVNLVVCTIERLPGVWRMVVLNNLNIDPQQLEKMSFTHRTNTPLMTTTAAERMRQLLVEAGWGNSRRLEREGAILLFDQKGAWTRLGVYIVHMSVLIIMAGAMIGTFFGFQAYVFLPEGRATSTIFLQGNRAPVSLGFELQCDRFEKSFYPNGMIKQYRTDLTVLDPKRNTPYQKSIIVNDPLTYQGLTFYQADSYPLEEFFVLIRNQKTGMEQEFRVPPKRDVAWQGTGATFRIEELKSDQDGAVQKAKIVFTTDAGAEPSVFWLKDKGTVTIGQPGAEFTISFRQFYTTLLLVTKDPGVWIVYLGCITMFFGLAISFFLSHRRIWVRISTGTKQDSLILVSGASNKNNPAFEQKFQALVNRLEQDKTISTDKTGA